MHRFALNVPVDVQELREQLRKMSDEELRRFGRAAQFMCSPGTNSGKPPQKRFVAPSGLKLTHRFNRGSPTFSSRLD